MRVTLSTVMMKFPSRNLAALRYQDLLSKHDIAHLLSGIVFGMDSPQSNPYVVCSLLRGLKGGAFKPYERDRLAILVLHLSRSLGVMTRLQELQLKASASLAALDKLSVRVLLFDARGLATFANRAAHRILQEEDGLQLQHRFGDSSLGEIVAEASHAHEALTSAIQQRCFTGYFACCTFFSCRDRTPAFW